MRKIIAENCLHDKRMMEDAIAVAKMCIIVDGRYLLGSYCRSFGERFGGTLYIGSGTGFFHGYLQDSAFLRGAACRQR
jgi:hypothetical protein